MFTLLTCGNCIKTIAHRHTWTIYLKEIFLLPFYIVVTIIIFLTLSQRYCTFNQWISNFNFLSALLDCFLSTTCILPFNRAKKKWLQKEKEWEKCFRIVPLLHFSGYFIIEFSDTNDFISFSPPFWIGLRAFVNNIVVKRILTLFFCTFFFFLCFSLSCIVRNGKCNASMPWTTSLYNIGWSCQFW